MKYFLLIIPIAVILFTRCDNWGLDNNQSNYSLSFSSDTISFDTVFTTIGSATLQLRVKNTNPGEIDISSIHLANNNSFFRMNVDGESGDNITDVSIQSEDSIYIFVEVTIDPTNEDNPVFIEDSIVFELKSGYQYVHLQAYGQDVNILRNDTIETSTTWTGKPYLIFGDIRVKEGNTLTIEPGMTVYCHDSASINVLGNIEVNGTIDEPVTFRGDRLDEIWEGYKYDYVSGQWSGIFISPSEKKSSFSNCVIRNAIYGLYIGSYDTEIRTKVDLYNVVIHNNSYVGLLAFNAEMTIANCQITNTGYYNFMVIGGAYNVYQSTIANYYGLDYNTSREDNVCFALTNVIQYDEESYIVFDLDEANFYNCIIDGEYDNEMAYQLTTDYAFNFKFDHCLLKVDESITDDFSDNFSSCYFNEDPGFRSIAKWNYDFQLDTLSYAIDMGDTAVLSKNTALEFDLNGNSRLLDGKPDLGAYEFVPTEEE